MNAPAFALPFIGYPKIFKYAMTYFDGAKRLKRRQTQFPLDCQKAYDLGVQLCKLIKGI